MINEELSLTAIMDNTNPSNKLNNFKVDLPFPIYFNEPYSMALVDITYPNLLHNINNDNNYMGLSFYKQHPIGEVLKPNQLTKTINGVLHRLEVYANIPVKSGYYNTAENLAMFLKGYARVRYTSNDEIKNDNELLNMLFHMGVSNLDLSEVNECAVFYKKAIHTFVNIDDTSTQPPPSIKGLTFGELKASVKAQLTENDELCPSVFTRNKAFWDLWFVVPEINTINFIYGYTNEFISVQPQLGSIDFPHLDMKTLNAIYRLYGLACKIYINILQSLKTYNVREIMVLSVDFYFSILIYLDICRESVTGEHVITEGIQRLLDDVDNLNNKPNTIWLGEVKDALQHLSGCNEATDLGILSAANQEKIYKGIERRIDLFFFDLTKVINHIKKIDKYKQNQIDYLTSINKAFIYVDPNLIGSSEISLNRAIRHELGFFFSRIKQDGLKVSFHPKHSSYRTKRILGKFYTDYTEITFQGEELEPFFGHQGSIMLQDIETFTPAFQPAIQLRNTNFFLYCNQIREQYVNDLMTPLLATVPIPPSSERGHPVHVNFKSPHFLNLNSNHLDHLSFSIRNRQSEAAKFGNTSQTVILLLLLRPTKRGII